MIFHHFQNITLFFKFMYISNRHFLLFERADIVRLPRRFAPRNDVCLVAKDLRW